MSVGPVRKHDSIDIAGTSDSLGSLVLARSTVTELIRHAIAGLPAEVAGLLGADGRGVAQRAVPVPAGRATADSVSYRVEAMDAAADRLAAEGLRPVARYHSHPNYPARPSLADRLQMAPGEIDVIIGFRGGPGPRIRAWRLPAGARHPVAVPVRIEGQDDIEGQEH